MKKTKEILFEMMQEAVELGLYQEELKQETLEQAAKNHLNSGKIPNDYQSFIAGTKWQQERMYSDMQEYAEFCVECDRAGLKLIVAKDWYTQFKNNK